MNTHRLSIWLLALALLVSGATAACEKKQSPQAESKPAVPAAATARPGVVVSLSAQEKQALLQVARKTFDQYVTDHSRYTPKELPAGLAEKKGNTVFATIYKDGEWRGCVAGSGSTLVEMTVNAVINTCNDKRFKNPEPKELDQFRVELSILQPEELVTGKDPIEIGKQLEPGVHGIMIRHSSGHQAFFLPYVFVKAQRDVATWLERISVKGGMDKDAWKSPEASIFRFATINFIEDRANGRALDLYRYKVQLPSLEKDALPAAVALTGQWFAGQAAAQKRLPNVQEPVKAKSESAYESDARQLFGLAAWAYGADAHRDLATMRKVSDLFDSYYARLKPDAKSGQILENANPAGLETTLIAADIVTTSGLLPDRHKKAAAFFDALKTALNGGFPQTLTDGTVLPDLPNYAVAVLLRLAAQSRREPDKKFARDFAAKTWSSGKTNSLQAVIAAAELLDDAAWSKRAEEEIVTWSQAQIVPGPNVFKDHIGAYNYEKLPTTIGVALPLFALARATELVRLTTLSQGVTTQLNQNIVLATRWLLEQQFTAQSAFYLPNHKPLEGAFKHDVLIHESRLEDTAAAYFALISLEGNAKSELARAGEQYGALLAK